MHERIDIQHALIKRCKRGDTAAQFELYQIHARYMYNVAYNLLKHTAEAEDVMQEAFLKAFRKLESFKGEVSFAAWLRKIVVNKSLDVLRQRKEWVAFSTQEHHLNEEADFAHFDDESSVLPKVKQALAQLADGYRTVLSLYLLEGYDHKEIAQFLNITEVASRSQYSRAKKKLAEVLKIMQVTYEIQ